MDFTKFTKEELIGRKVLITGTDHGAYIRIISKVGKATFSIDNNVRFGISTGRLWGGGIWSTSWAELLSEERAAEIAEKWRAKKELDSLRSEIHPLLKDATIEQLTEIKSILSKNA